MTVTGASPDSREDDATCERARVLALLREHGWNATSFQVLERGFTYWFDPGLHACVAYVDTGAAWVAAGAPIASTAHVQLAAERFIAAARAARRRACFFAVEDRFLASNPTLSSTGIGEQPSWDPVAWPDVSGPGRSLREQLRRARAKGVTVRPVPPSEMAEPTSAVRRGVERLVLRWLAGRRMPPMGFIVDVQLFEFVEERRCFVAERDGSIVGVLVAVPIYKRHGWLFEDLLRDPGAPNGTTELLFDAAMRTLGGEGSRYVTLGLAPLAGEVRPWLRFLRDSCAALYDFDGVVRFKAKLRPSLWTPIYLAWPRGGSGNRALLDSLAAFTMRPRDGRESASFIRFGLETLAHAPTIGVRLLVACLIPWTIALLLAPTERFFPSRAVQLGWVVWDIGLALALLALAMRWRFELARGLAVATSLDALLTVVEAASDGVHRVHTALDVTILVVACAGPAMASLQLWGALAWRARRAR